MKEDQFRRLLDKHMNGSITDAEREVLESFSKSLDDLGADFKFQDEVHKSEVKNAMWTSIKKETKKKPEFYVIKKVAAIAAIFLMCLFSAYFLIERGKQSSANLIQGNDITIQLQDGTLKTIEENGNSQIMNSEGKVVGIQKGSKLVYQKPQNKNIKDLSFNTLSVPYGKKFQILLSDGTKAYVNSGSSITYPTQFLNEGNRNISVKGEVYLEVAKDPNHPFIVSANNLNVKVLGTQFNVSAYPEDISSEIVLVEGSVSLYTELSESTNETGILLEPGFKGSFNTVSNTFEKEKVITKFYTSWINGDLIFRDMNFENILKKLERHYNVKIINKNKFLSNKKFNANFGDESITTVLNELKTNYSIQYEIKKDGQIIIE